MVQEINYLISLAIKIIQKIKYENINISLKFLNNKSIENIKITQKNALINVFKKDIPFREFILKNLMRKLRRTICLFYSRNYNAGNDHKSI